MESSSERIINPTPEPPFYVWFDGGACQDYTNDLQEAFQWAREIRLAGRPDVYIADANQVVHLPECRCCSENGENNLAFFTAAQSIDQGATITYCDICTIHAREWNEGSDWLAPIYPYELRDIVLRPRFPAGSQ